MLRDDRILVTGATGMVGSAVVRQLRKLRYSNILCPTRKELDLEDAMQVHAYFRQHRPQHVLMIAAKVGGIAANQADPVGFLNSNIRIQQNLFDSCHRYKTEKNLFLGSSCIYPRECPQPMKESYLLTGPLEPTNEAYALAKIVGLKTAWSYYQQYGMLTICPMPCNVYGTGDHFDLQRAHVLSALVRRFADAKDAGVSQVTLWGTGTARREFLHVSDLARAICFLMDVRDTPEIINVGTGTDVTIRELAEMIASEIGYVGSIQWDTTKPDGMPRKCLDISQLHFHGFEPSIDLITGVRLTIAEYYYLKINGRV